MAGQAGGARERLFTPAFVALGLAELAYFTAAGVGIYGVPVFVTGPVGSDEAGAGIAFGAFALTALLLRPVAGRLTDTHGRRPLLLGGALLASVALGGLAGVTTLPAVIVLRLVLGVAEAAFFVASFAAVADLAPRSRLGEALSYNSLGLYLGITIGTPLGEGLVRRGGFGVAWLTAAGLCVAAALLVLRVGETRAGPPEPGRIHFVLVSAIPTALGFLASIVPMGAFLAFVALRAGDVGLEAASLPLIAYGTTVVVCRVVFARVPDRNPPLRLGATALATIALGLGLAGLVSSGPALVGCAVVLGVGVAFSTPAFFSAIFRAAGPGERGAASATASVAIDLGLGGGPILFGLVAGQAGIGAAFVAAAGVAVVGAVWTLHLHRTRPAGRAGLSG